MSARRLICLCALLLVALCLPVQAAAAANTGTVRVLLVDALGTPLKGTVTLSTGATKAADANGVAEFTNLPYGMYSATSAVTGMTGPAGVGTINAASQVATITVILHRSYTSQAPPPAPGSPAAPSAPPPAWPSAPTAPAPQTPPGHQGAGGKLTGQICTGQAASVTVTGGGVSQHVSTPDGHFSVQDLPAGTYSITASIDGKVVKAYTVRIGSGSPMDAHVTLCPDRTPKLPPTGSGGLPYALSGGGLLAVGAWLARRKGR